jgi:hypothetical protein
MGAYAKFKGARPMADRNWIIPGQHVFQIQRMQIGPSKNPMKKNVENCIVELKTLASDTMKVGDFCAFVDTDENPKGGYLGNVNALVAGILGISIDEMNADDDFDSIFENAFGVAQYFTGLIVRCTAQKSASSEYTQKKWEALPASLYAEFGQIAPEGAFEG